MTNKIRVPLLQRIRWVAQFSTTTDGIVHRTTLGRARMRDDAGRWRLDDGFSNQWFQVEESYSSHTEPPVVGEGMGRGKAICNVTPHVAYRLIDEAGCDVEQAFADFGADRDRTRCTLNRRTYDARSGTVVSRTAFRLSSDDRLDVPWDGIGYVIQYFVMRTPQGRWFKYDEQYGPSTPLDLARRALADGIPALGSAAQEITPLSGYQAFREISIYRPDAVATYWSPSTVARWEKRASKEWALLKADLRAERERNARSLVDAATIGGGARP